MKAKSVLFCASLMLFSMSTFAENMNASQAINKDQAKEIAVKAYPGTVISETQKKSVRGKVAQYIFKIKDGELIQNVKVDAKSGNIVSYKVEGYQGK